MRVVVDCSAFDSPALPEFLRASTSNVAILIDVASHELFATGGDARRLLAPFANREQALLLKPSWQIWRLRPKSNGYVPKFIDREQMRAFPQHCGLLAAGNAVAIKNLDKKKRQARKFGDELLGDAHSMLGVMRN